MYKIKCDRCNALAINGRATHESGCYGTMIYTKRKREYLRFRVWSLDVLGNKRDGFEVNDRSERGSIMVPRDASDAAIIRAMKAKDLLGKRTRLASFVISGDEHSQAIDWRNTGEPLYQLEAS